MRYSSRWLTVGAIAIALMLQAIGAWAITGDMLTFMDCNLPYEQYIAVHGEHRADGNSPWQDMTGCYQSFRSKVNYKTNQMYWRKDCITDDYYGELYTFDANNIYLHAETFPAKQSVDPPGQPAWDQRYDRFRLFVKNGQSDWGLGRTFAPVNASTSWSYSGYMNTYICNSFAQYNGKTAPLFQSNFYDNHVYLERYGPFSTVFDGEMANWTADPEFKTFDEVIVVNQCMANDAGRERFFYARKGGTYYGIVRWDNSIKINGVWTVVDRTMGLKKQSLWTGMSFGGMYKRARCDNYILHSPRVNTGDINGDAYDDYSFINGTGGIQVGLGSMLVNNMSNSMLMYNPWGTQYTSQGTWNKPMGVGDLNGDGYADFWFLCGDGSIWTGTGSANGQSTGIIQVVNPWGTQFTSQQSWNKPIGVGDINNDGYADFWFLSGDGGMWVGTGSANGQSTGIIQVFNPWGVQFTSQQAWNKPLGIGDINGDGYADFVFINGSGNIYVGTGSANGQGTGIISLNNPWTGFTSQQSTYKPLAVCDVNGDGYADIVVIDSNGIITAGLTDGTRIFNLPTVNNPWGTQFTSQTTWNKSIQQGFGWGWWF